MVRLVGVSLSVALTVCDVAAQAGQAGQAAPDKAAPAGNCRGAINPAESVRFGGYRSNDGKLQFRIAYDRSVTPFHEEAFQKAIAMWNRYTDLTGIVLEDRTRGDADFRVQLGAPPRRRGVESTTCASYESNGSFIWISALAMTEIVQARDVQAAARIYAHELGHALNVRHKTGQSVMVEGDPQAGCLDLGTKILTEVQRADAEDVLKCAHSVHGGERAAGLPQPRR